jgi:hypothetical protein
VLFNILVGNHGSSFHSLQLLGPLVNYVRSTLSLCGHDVTVARSTWNEDAVNLLFEHFPDPQFWTGEIRNARRDRGCVVGVVATELLVGNTIPYAKNGIRASDIAGQDERAQALYIQKRIEGLNAVAPEADFLWSFLERTAREYQPRCAQSRFFPVGYTAGPPRETRLAPKDIDVAFFGTLTPHRDSVLKKMASQGLNVVAVGQGTPAGVVPDYIVASLLDRARIGLNLTLSAVGESPPGLDPRFASCIRVVQMLERELCVVSEDIPLDNPYQDFMRSSPLEALAETCARLLDTGEWREHGMQSAALFREQMHAGRICAPVISETLKTLDARD